MSEFTIAQMIAELEREITMRRVVYPKSKISPVTAANRISILETVLAYLRKTA